MKNKIGPSRKLLLALLAASLGGCGISSLYIDLDANYEDSEMWFEDPQQGWLTSHCVRNVTVTRIGMDDGRDESDPKMWQASGLGAECLTGVPFRYGAMETPPDPDRRYTPAKPLEAGASYEIEVELSNGAGSGRFTIAEDGSISNDG
jgi:hypothetical protein